MMVLPVYQMGLGEDDNGKPGLVFTTELDNDNQSLIFAIPIPEGYLHTFELLDEMDNKQIVFPFLLKDKYYNLVGEINFTEVVFRVPEVDIRVVFELNDIGFLAYSPFVRRPFRYNKYVGKHKSLLVKHEGFLAIAPADMSELNDLYSQHKGVFVGFTPNFGQLDNETNRQE